MRIAATGGMAATIATVEAGLVGCEICVAHDEE